jgi:hypothetical protein
MRKINWIFLSLLCLGIFHSYSANAFLVLSYKSENLNKDKPTRILVTGAGKEQGTQFQEVANAKALKYSELYPDEQIVLIAKNENAQHSPQSILKRWGYTIQYENHEHFDGDSLVRELSLFKNISSIDIFAHGTAQYGVYLEDTQSRLSPETKSIINLRGHFAQDAYIFLHGCNTGFTLAPHLSNVLDLPVAGSLTSSDFQRLHSDGSFYLTQEDYYPNSDWAQSNSSSFNQATNCKEGRCIRLKPDNHPYVGFWGEYKGGGLPFYKFFCVNNSQKDCSRIMAKSLYSFIGTTNLKLNSNFKEYKNLLGDFLCPISGSHDYRRVCREKLDLSLLTFDSTFNPFRGPQLECDFKGCKAEFKCKLMRHPNLKNAKICYTSMKSRSSATTLINEYEAYLSGFKELHGFD